MNKTLLNEPSSFRDPSAVVLYRDNMVYRRINLSYKKQYDHLMQSGLYKKLEGTHLISHKETENDQTANSYKIIKPTVIPFISYPYEWCFAMLKDAALLTLNIHREALNFDMVLKDASCYNVQFVGGNPIFIDTSSFDFYEDGTPWVAYGQFCRHFLAPLCLMAHKDIRLAQLLRVYIDGIPLDLAADLLGKKGGAIVWQHIRLHAKAIKKYASPQPITGSGQKKINISKFRHTALIDQLIRVIGKLSINENITEWSDYYKRTNYSDKAANAKRDLIDSFIAKTNATTIFDMGANDGTYSRLACSDKSYVVAFDLDHTAVSHNYAKAKQTGERILPLLLDLTNPSPAIGFANVERQTIITRKKPDLIMALAIIHHLVISNNIPLSLTARYFADICEYLIIEFVPKEDSQTEKLLKNRVDIFTDYHIDGFESAFGDFFSTLNKHHIDGSVRTLYLFRRKPTANHKFI